MSVAQSTAERLLAHSSGPAVDILFRSTTTVNGNMTTAPSSQLVMDRWSKLPAASAIEVARVVTDAALLDHLAAKEKRKTVRLSIASNPALHPVTRLYYLQTGLVEHDAELLSTVFAGFTPEQLVELISNDPSLQYKANDRRNRQRLGGGVTDVATFLMLTKFMSGSTLSDLFEQMLIANPVRALDILEQSGYQLTELYRFSVTAVGDDVSNHHRLMKLIGRPVYVDLVVNAYSTSLDFLAKIDPSLLMDALSGRIAVTAETVALYRSHGMLDDLVRSSNVRFRADGAVAALAVLTNSSDRAKVIFDHPEEEDAASLAQSEPNFIARVLERYPAADVTEWIVNHARCLGPEASYAMFVQVPGVELNARSVERLNNRLQMSIERVLMTLPDSVLSTIDSLPRNLVVEDPMALLERCQAMPATHATVALSILTSFSESVTTEVRIKAVSVLLDQNRDSLVAEWLGSADAEAIAGLLKTHRAQILTMVGSVRRLQNARWAPAVVEFIKPAEGWGSFTNTHMLKAIMDFLAERIGDDVRTWESVLVLFDDWTGSLDELVVSARLV